MRISIIFIFALVFLLGTTTCDYIYPCGLNKDDFLVKYENLLEEVSNDRNFYSAAEWKVYDERFRHLAEECYDQYEAEMSFKEQRQFWAKAMKYYYRRYGAGVADELFDRENELSQKIKAEMKEVWGDLDGKELENVLDEIGKDVEKWGKKLEEVFKK